MLLLGLKDETAVVDSPIVMIEVSASGNKGSESRAAAGRKPLPLLAAAVG